MRLLLETDDDILLDPAVEAMLRTVAQAASERGEMDAAEAYSWHANLLSACRTRGRFSGVRARCGDSE